MWSNLSPRKLSNTSITSEFLENSEDIPLVETHLFGDFLIGSALGLSFTLTGQPFDAVRLNAQAGNIGSVNSLSTTRQVAQYMYKKEGMKIFFSGVIPPAIGMTLGRAIQQSTMNLMRDYFILKQRAEYEAKELARIQHERALAEEKERNLPFYANSVRALNSKTLMNFVGIEERPAILSHTASDDYGSRWQNEMSLPLWKNILAATTGAIMYTTVYTPFDLLRVRMSTQNQYSHRIYHNSIDCAYQLYECGGIKKLYLGYQATLIRDIPAQIILFGSYGVFRNLLPQDENHTVQARYGALTGALSGIVQWLCIIPFDNIKTRMQTEVEDIHVRPTWKESASRIYVLYGVRGYYVGLFPALLKASLSNAALFSVMEFFGRRVGEFQKAHRRERLQNNN